MGFGLRGMMYRLAILVEQWKAMKTHFLTRIYLNLILMPEGREKDKVGFLLVLVLSFFV